MEKELKSFLVAVFGQMLGITDESKVAALIFDADDKLKGDAASVLISKDKERIAKLKTDHAAEIKQLERDIPARVKRESLTTLEEEIKKQFKLETDKVGLQLIEELVAKSSKDGNGKELPLTEENVKRSKYWIDREQQFNKTLADKETEAINKVNEANMKYEERDIYSRVEKRALELVAESGAVLPDEKEFPVAYRNQLNAFIKSIREDLEFQKHGEGSAEKLIPISKANKKPVENEHGNQLDTDTVLLDRIKQQWPIVASQKKDAPDPLNKNQGGGAGQKKYSTIVPKIAATREEYVSHIEKIRGSNLSEADKDTAQIEYVTDYEAQQSAG